MFGTFEPEGEQAEYGVLDQPEGYNPIKLNFHVWQDVVRNMRNAGSFRKAVKVLFDPPNSLKK